MSAISILGLGNVLLGDEKFGPQVVRRFAAEYEVDPEVAVLDFGTPGFDLAPFLMDSPAVIIVGTIAAPGAAGELRFYDKAEIQKVGDEGGANPHHPKLTATLLILDVQGGGPEEVRFIGAIPGSLATGAEMTEPVRAAIPTAIGALIEELTERGFPPRRREVAAESDLWWETNVGC